MSTKLYTSKTKAIIIIIIITTIIIFIIFFIVIIIIFWPTSTKPVGTEILKYRLFGMTLKNDCHDFVLTETTLR